MYQSDLRNIGKHYQPRNPNEFAQNLALASGIFPKTKLKDLTQIQFEQLISTIEKFCKFTLIGNEEFYLLPKIVGKIECVGQAPLYLIGTHIALTHNETVQWIKSHRLDGVVAHQLDGHIHIRSRPHYHMQTLKLTWEQHAATGEIEILARSVGTDTPGQCIWGFINGIWNTEVGAKHSASLISKKANGQRVLSLRNDSFPSMPKDIGIALLLKLGLDTSLVKNATIFFKHLLSISDSQPKTPLIIVFAHSQGAAIAEHALAALSVSERQRIRIFTFGGWSFIDSSMAHPDSHNYASLADVIPQIGSCNLQYLAMKKYKGIKQGLTEEKIIQQLAYADTMKIIEHIPPLYPLEKLTQERVDYYKTEFKKLSNITILDSANFIDHSFDNEIYQPALSSIIEKYLKTSQ